VSDQDFFFDEEDDKPAEKPTAKSTSKPAPRKTTASRTTAAKTAGTKAAAPKSPQKAPTTSAPAPAAGGFFDQNVNMAIASLAVVCALLLGMVVGLYVGESRGSGSIDTSSTTNTSVAAPQLTQQQLAAPLPTGHPAIQSAPATGTK
jgi:hypothetical protein